MKFQKGDIVLVGNGKVHWEVVDPGNHTCVIRSGMTGRHMWAETGGLKRWNPGD